MQDYFLFRTWNKTSKKICDANALPPGFRIVLLNEHGRAIRDDILVRSGNFGGFPASFSVGLFLTEAMSIMVKDSNKIGYCEIQLRDHRNGVLDPELRLRRIRAMPGTKGKYSKASKDADSKIQELVFEIEAVNESIFSEQCYDDQPDLLLMAHLQYIIESFDIEAFDDAIELVRPLVEIRRKRKAKFG